MGCILRDGEKRASRLFSHVQRAISLYARCSSPPVCAHAMTIALSALSNSPTAPGSRSAMSRLREIIDDIDPTAPSIAANTICSEISLCSKEALMAAARTLLDAVLADTVEMSDDGSRRALHGDTYPELVCSVLVCSRGRLLICFARTWATMNAHMEKKGRA